MIWFSIVGEDVPNSLEKRMSVRAEHLARLEALKSEDRLLVAGPNPLPESDTGFSGSIIIAKFDNLAAAQVWANQDPYIAAGVYQHVAIKPFKWVLGRE